MVLEGMAKKLKIIIPESDRVYQRSLYEAIIFAAKKYTLAGTTITKGFVGYGANGLTDSSKTYTLSYEHPIIIEIIDNEQRIEDFTKVVAGLIEKADAPGIIYIEDVNVVLYRKKEKAKSY